MTYGKRCGCCRAEWLSPAQSSMMVERCNQVLKVHMAVDTLGHLLAMVVTLADAQERAQVAELSKAVQAVTNQQVEMAFVDQGYTGSAAAQEGIALCVVKLEESKKGFVLLPRRWAECA